MNLKSRFFFNKLIIKESLKESMKQQKDLIGHENMTLHKSLNEIDECRDDVFYEKIVRTEIAKINILRAERR